MGQDFEDYEGISSSYHQTLPTKLREKYTVHSKVAVFAGSARSGRGVNVNNFFTINRDPEEFPDLIADFNQPYELRRFANQFDSVVIELPGPENSWSPQIYRSAYQILKPGGLLEVSNYGPNVDLVRIPTSEFQNQENFNAIVYELFGYSSLNEYREKWNRGGTLNSSESEVLLQWGFIFYLNLFSFTPLANPDYKIAPLDPVPPIQCENWSDLFKSSTNHKHTYCYFQKRQPGGFTRIRQALRLGNALTVKTDWENTAPDFEENEWN